MRAFRTTTPTTERAAAGPARTAASAAVLGAVVLGAVLLAGCGSDGQPGPGGAGRPAATASPSPAPSAGSVTPGAPGTGPAPGPPASGLASGSPPGPAAVETLLRVSRTGGYAGRTHTLIVKGDGSWARLDGSARPEGAGRLAPAGLEALRGALREADLPRLPRVAMSDRPVFDGFVYAFVHAGTEVTCDQSSLTPGLSRVLDRLPPFEPPP
ncbi:MULTISPECIES: hypothetical protein [unclassified Streptomyces]|uniref:hypothetical protein n=1 Tax=unclassified Streptomyces TaxID=2593676 RepID=UPI0036525AC9